MSNHILRYMSHCVIAIAGLALVGLSGCASDDLVRANAVDTTPSADANGVPRPILGNTGRYMCPFTEDKTITAWVEKGKTAAAASATGGAIGAYAGQQAAKKLGESIPFIGGLLGQALGESAGREVAIAAAGGWEFIKKNSDLSFNSLYDMARYVKAHHASHPEFNAAIEATYGIYPEFRQAMATSR
jgi:hypothetical protein